MKLYLRIILPFGIQKPLALCQVHQVAVFVFHYITLLKARKVFNGFLITRYPACLVETKRHKSTRRAIFLQQAVLYHLKLQFTHTTNNFSVAPMLGK